jgi:hypothetical protein
MTNRQRYRDDEYPDDRRYQDHDRQYDDGYHDDRYRENRDPYFGPQTEPTETDFNDRAHRYDHEKGGRYVTDPPARQGTGDDRYLSDRRGEYDEYYATDERYHSVDDTPHFGAHARGDRTDPLIYHADDNEHSASGITISAADLRDTNRPTPFPRFNKTAGRIAALIGLGVVAMLMYLTLQPEVTAYDIVSMQDYEGQQRPAWTLEPDQVTDCDTMSSCFKEQLARSQQPAESDSTIQEIPASTQVEVVPAVVDSSTVLPGLMQVTQQWSNIRNAPNMSGDIIASIARNLEVTILGQTDNWYEIMTLDGRDLQGYMHKNTLKKR